ncbi:MAG TPA: Ig-like domain-containing protein, partial [Terriglobia bacterium]|nr:Ig-like domain-containing protein [Terriglobia bacterium]
TQTGSDLAPGTVTGSNPGLTTETATGALSLGSGVTVVGGLSQTGLFGVLQVDAAGHFTYTLTKNDLTGPANDGTNTAVNAETFTVTIRDADGNTATDTIHVSIVDNVPTAQADSGGTLDTNTTVSKSAADGVLLNDLFGADGKDAGGGVVGVAFGANTGTIGSGLAGNLGTLTLNADGSYSYTSKNNVEGTDVFSYTIKDGDGDLSTTTLTFTVHDQAQGTLNNAAVTVAEDSEPNQNTGDLTITKGTIDLSGILTPADNEVVTSITITNIPTGVVISDGSQTVTGDGTNSITILAANFGTVTLQQPLDNKDNDYALSYSAVISDPTSGNTNTLSGGLINVTVDAAADQPTAVSITVNDSADSGSGFSNGETGSLNVKATFGDYQDGSEVHTVTVHLESGFSAALSATGSLAGATYTYNAATGVIVFTVPNGTASLDASFAVTAPASGALPGILNFTATATATETNFGGSEPVSGNNVSSVTVTTGIPATRILDGTITTNTASGSQEMILTFIDTAHPLDAFAQLFIRDAEGQQGAFLTDAGFNIDHSHDFGVTVENAIDGHSVLITDMAVEGVSVVSKGTVQLDHDDGSNKPVAITDIIHPGAGTDDGRINSTDDTSNHAGTLADPDGTHTNYLYGGALNDTVTATHTPTDTDNGDILNGGAGSNVLTGGSGNDVLVYNPLDTSEDGGAGFDILRVDQGALYNSESQGGYVVPGLTNATVDFGANNSAVHNIEAVLITEEAVPDANLGTTVKLSAQDVFNFSSDHELYVIGSAGDKVDLTYDAKGTWNDTGTTVTSSGGQAFEVWHGTSASGQVTLYIDHDLTTQVS